jgi:hypothetical protein
VNLRFLNNINSPIFDVNSFVVRVSSFPLPGQTPQLALCNATLCAGTPIPVLNPSPVLGSNVDTIYGAFTWDLGATVPGVNPGTALKFVLLANNQIRYSSMILYDHWTNVVSEVTSFDQTPGQNTLFCFAQSAAHPTCQQLAATNGARIVVLPRYGFGILRVYSTGAPAPQGCGVDGCAYTLGVRSQFAVLQPAPTGLKYYNVTYGQYMSPNPPVPGSTCPYSYAQTPCGNGNKNAFWDALCVALADNPVTGAEATYVENTFGGLGIHPTGCSALQYNTLNSGFLDGYNYVVSKWLDPSLTVTSGIWNFLPFNGQWGVQDLQTALARSIAATRLAFLNANAKAAYWVTFQDSDGNDLNGAWGATYKLVWKSSDPFVDATRGFWSVTIYDTTGFLYIPPPGTDQKQYAVRGTAPPAVGDKVPISNVCKSSTCLRAPPGKFTLAIRAYGPQANVLPGGNYVFPDVVKCDCHTPCY